MKKKSDIGHVCQKWRSGRYIKRPDSEVHSTVFSIAFLLSCSILKLRPIFLILNIKLFFPSDETNVLLFFPVLTC